MTSSSTIFRFYHDFWDILDNIPEDFNKIWNIILLTSESVFEFKLLLASFGKKLDYLNRTIYDEDETLSYSTQSNKISHQKYEMLIAYIQPENQWRKQYI